MWKNRKLKVLNITHYNLDGAISSILLKNFYKEVFVEPVAFNDDKRIIKTLSLIGHKYDLIIFTNYVSKLVIDTTKKLKLNYYVFDHHQTTKQLTTLGNVAVKTDRSTSKLLHSILDIANSMIEFEKLVNYSNDFEMGFYKEKTAQTLNALFWKMGFHVFVNRFVDGNIKYNHTELGMLKKYYTDYKEFYENLIVSDLEHNGVFCETTDFISDTIIDLLKDYDWVVLKNKTRLYIKTKKENLDLIKVCMALKKPINGNSDNVIIELNEDENVLLSLERMNLALA